VQQYRETYCINLVDKEVCMLEVILGRLLNQDNIGIVPKYDSLHRANQSFPEDQDVHDVMYFDDLGRYKKRIKQFVTWKPLPMLVPKDQTSW
jgi:hypothetical protein